MGDYMRNGIVGEFPRLRVLAEPTLTYGDGFNSLAGSNRSHGLNSYQSALPRTEPAQGINTQQLSSRIEAQPLSFQGHGELQSRTRKDN